MQKSGYFAVVNLSEAVFMCENHIDNIVSGRCVVGDKDKTHHVNTLYAFNYERCEYLADWSITNDFKFTAGMQVKYHWSAEGTCFEVMENVLVDGRKMVACRAIACNTRADYFVSGMRYTFHPATLKRVEDGLEIGDYVTLTYTSQTVFRIEGFVYPGGCQVLCVTDGNVGAYNRGGMYTLNANTLKRCTTPKPTVEHGDYAVLNKKEFSNFWYCEALFQVTMIVDWTTVVADCLKSANPKSYEVGKQYQFGGNKLEKVSPQDVLKLFHANSIIKLSTHHHSDAVFLMMGASPHSLGYCDLKCIKPDRRFQANIIYSLPEKDLMKAGTIIGDDVKPGALFKLTKIHGSLARFYCREISGDMCEAVCVLPDSKRNHKVGDKYGFPLSVCIEVPPPEPAKVFLKDQVFKLHECFHEHNAQFKVLRRSEDFGEEFYYALCLVAGKDFQIGYTYTFYNRFMEFMEAVHEPVISIGDKFTLKSNHRYEFIINYRTSKEVRGKCTKSVSLGHAVIEYEEDVDYIFEPNEIVPLDPEVGEEIEWYDDVVYDYNFGDQFTLCYDGKVKFRVKEVEVDGKLISECIKGNRDFEENGQYNIAAEDTLPIGMDIPAFQEGEFFTIRTDSNVIFQVETVLPDGCLVAKLMELGTGRFTQIRRHPLCVGQSYGFFTAHAVRINSNFANGDIITHRLIPGAKFEVIDANGLLLKTKVIERGTNHMVDCNKIHYMACNVAVKIGRSKFSENDIIKSIRIKDIYFKYDYSFKDYISGTCISYDPFGNYNLGQEYAMKLADCIPATNLPAKVYENNDRITLLKDLTACFVIDKIYGDNRHVSATCIRADYNDRYEVTQHYILSTEDIGLYREYTDLQSRDVVINITYPGAEFSVTGLGKDGGSVKCVCINPDDELSFDVGSDYIFRPNVLRPIPIPDLKTGAIYYLKSDPEIKFEAFCNFTKDVRCRCVMNESRSGNFLISQYYDLPKGSLAICGMYEVGQLVNLRGAEYTQFVVLRPHGSSHYICECRNVSERRKHAYTVSAKYRISENKLESGMFRFDINKQYAMRLDASIVFEYSGEHVHRGVGGGLVSQMRVLSGPVDGPTKLGEIANVSQIMITSISKMYPSFSLGQTHCVFKTGDRVKVKEPPYAVLRITNANVTPFTAHAEVLDAEEGSPHKVGNTISINKNSLNPAPDYLLPKDIIYRKQNPRTQFRIDSLHKDMIRVTCLTSNDSVFQVGMDYIVGYNEVKLQHVPNYSAGKKLVHRDYPKMLFEVRKVHDEHITCTSLTSNDVFSMGIVVNFKPSQTAIADDNSPMPKLGNFAINIGDRVQHSQFPSAVFDVRYFEADNEYVSCRCIDAGIGTNLKVEERYSYPIYLLKKCNKSVNAPKWFMKKELSCKAVFKRDGAILSHNELTSISGRCVVPYDIYHLNNLHFFDINTVLEVPRPDFIIGDHIFAINFPQKIIFRVLACFINAKEPVKCKCVYIETGHSSSYHLGQYYLLRLYKTAFERIDEPVYAAGDIVVLKKNHCAAFKIEKWEKEMDTVQAKYLSEVPYEIYTPNMEYTLHTDDIEVRPQSLPRFGSPLQTQLKPEFKNGVLVHLKQQPKEVYTIVRVDPWDQVVTAIKYGCKDDPGKTFHVDEIELEECEQSMSQQIKPIATHISEPECYDNQPPQP